MYSSSHSIPMYIQCSEGILFCLQTKICLNMFWVPSPSVLS